MFLINILPSSRHTSFRLFFHSSKQSWKSSFVRASFRFISSIESNGFLLEQSWSLETEKSGKVLNQASMGRFKPGSASSDKITLSRQRVITTLHILSVCSILSCKIFLAVFLLALTEPGRPGRCLSLVLSWFSENCY